MAASLYNPLFIGQLWKEFPLVEVTGLLAQFHLPLALPLLFKLSEQFFQIPDVGLRLYLPDQRNSTPPSTRYLPVGSGESSRYLRRRNIVLFRLAFKFSTSSRP